MGVVVLGWPWQKLGQAFKGRMQAGDARYLLPVGDLEVGDRVTFRCDVKGEADQVTCKGTVVEVATGGEELTVTCPDLTADPTISAADVVEVTVNAYSVSPVSQGISPAKKITITVAL